MWQECEAADYSVSVVRRGRRGGEGEREGVEGKEERGEAGIQLTFSFLPFKSSWDLYPWNGAMHILGESFQPVFFGNGLRHTQNLACLLSNSNSYHVDKQDELHIV